MEAKELRIGNWVIVNEECQIEAIIHDAVDVSTRFETYVLDTVKPIPLTEEWLVRFNWNPPKDIGVAFSLTTDEIHFVAGNYYKKIEYVHQLQNLYFAITGEELTKNEQ